MNFFKQRFNHFLSNHHKLIGYLADLLGIVSAIAALAGWLGERTAWLWPAVAVTALCALVLAAARIYYLAECLKEQTQAFDLLVANTCDFLETGFNTAVDHIRQNGITSITNMAAAIQSLRYAHQSISATPEELTKTDKALALLAEYERQVRKQAP